MIDDEAPGDIGDEAVHLDKFSFVSSHGVACCGCVSGIPLVFRDRLIVGGVDDSERAALDGDQARATW